MAAQTTMPSRDENQDILHRRLAGLRDKLLDLSSRNRLLSFKHSDRSRTHIRIIDELPDVLFAKLKNGDKLTFQPLPEPESRPRDEETDEFLLALEAARATDEEYLTTIRALPEGEDNSGRQSKIERALRDRVRERLGMPPWVDRTELSKEELARSHGLEPGYDVPQPHGDEDEEEEEERHVDELIQTLLFPREMHRKLAGIRDQARTMDQEAGVNTLYAAFGFLEWRESNTSDRKHFSPLLLLPVSLEYKRGQPWGIYKLFSDLPDVETNKTLEIRLGRDFGFQMPAFSEDDTPETFLGKVGAAIEDRPDWRVRRFLTVGNFGFSKLAMYNDLDPDNWPENRALGSLELIRKVLLGTPPLDGAAIYAEDYEIDSPLIDAKNIALITDADASQHSAVIDVIKGKNLVIKGPPGTGKSQTITNIIAASLAEGKSILFVSEKMAALEVVEARLKDAGLTDFCLQVHSSKTSKTEVLESFRRRLKLGGDIPPPATLDDKLAELRDHRDHLNRYVSEINKPLGGMNLTVHQIFWGEKRAKTDGGNACSLVHNISFDDLTGIGLLTRSQAHNATRNAFKHATALAERYGGLDRLPWAWLKNESLNPFQIEALEGAMHTWVECLDRLKINIEKFEAQFAPLNNDNSVQGLNAVVDAIARLPDPSEPFVSVMAYLLVGLNLREAASQILILLSNKNGDNPDATKYFALAALPPLSEDWQEKAQRISEALDSINRDCPGHDNIARVQDEIAGLESDASRLSRLLNVTARLHSAADLDVELTHETVATALIAIGLLKEISREIFLHRSPQVLDETSEIPLTEAARKLGELISLREDLDRLMILRPLPKIEDINAHAATLRAAGAFGFLSARVREAKRYFKSIARDPRSLNIPQMIERGTRLAAYLDDRRLLAENRLLETICGQWFEGADTNFELLLKVNLWARNVCQKLPEADEHGVYRHFLLHGSADLLGDLMAGAENIDIEDALQLIKRLKEHGHGIKQIHAMQIQRINSLKEALYVLEKEGVGIEAPFPGAYDVAQYLQQMEPLRQRLAERKPSTRITSSLLAEALDFIENLSRNESLLSAIGVFASDDPQAKIDDLRSWSSEISDCLSLSAESHKKFSKLAVIDSEQLCDSKNLDDTSILALRDRLKLALADVSGLRDYLNLQSALATARQRTSPEFIDALITNPPLPERAVAAFDWLLYRGLAKLAFERVPDLNRFNGDDLQTTRGKFQELDREILELERARLHSTLCSSPIPYGNGIGLKSTYTDLALIEHELNKRKRHIPLRNLFARASGAIKALKPCFMMSPLSVATYLPPGKFDFDLVVIDEASQMPPEDALGAIARSDQVVVVGDPMQLPPTSFFKRFDDVMDDDDEDEDENIDVESILDQAYAVFRPARELRWHYRSRHQSLIAFSNKHFYDDSLTVFPSPIEESDKYGVRLIKVEGLYADRHNPKEAREMAAWAEKFMMDRPEETLGLVAVNQLQRDLLMDEMERIFQRNPRADAYRRSREGTLYPFFVKNLENVQGDERDVIAVSLVRGPNADGKVTQHFGPISQKNGHRRLNVLFTRARNQLVVFSSITPEQIQIRPNTARGPKVLRDYLDYALTGKLDSGHIGGRPPDSDFEVAVANRLRGYGYEVVPQVGVGGFYIDLGIRHPEFPGIFLVGVECDGATYHSAKSARDRDRIREKVLVDLGWKIYRIWSTDWFADPDAETEKFSCNIERVADERRELLRNAASGGMADEKTSRSQQDGQSQLDLDQIVDREVDESRGIVSDRIGDFSDDDNETDKSSDKRSAVSPTSTVEVGDTVSFHFDDRPEDSRVVTIVFGVSDAEQNRISRDSPIGAALLGSEVGDDVEVDTPGGVRVVIIDDISKPLSTEAVPKTPTEQADLASLESSATVDAATPQSGFPTREPTELPSSDDGEIYPSWELHRLPDPRESHRTDVARHLKEIIAVEGPVRVNRAYRIYSRACGIDRVGRIVRSKLNSALYHLVRQNEVVLEKEGPDDSQIHAVARLPNIPKVSIRPAGDRTFWEIPPSELAAVMREVQCIAPCVDADEIYRMVLARYDVGRLTKKIHAELTRIDRRLSDGGF